eukprot:m.230818 g.230818  ORF g.230818 m.230818 type:complete len:871 (-) comp16002_c0_seq25:274-2886(-)
MDPKDEETFGDDAGTFDDITFGGSAGEFSFEDLANRTADFLKGSGDGTTKDSAGYGTQSQSNAAVESALDAVLGEGSDDIQDSLARLMDDNDDMISGLSLGNVSDSWNKGRLLTPDQVSKAVTTNIAGKSTASIWSTFENKVEAPSSSEVKQDPATQLTTQTEPVLTLKELEEKLQKTDATLPPNIVQNSEHHTSGLKEDASMSPDLEVMGTTVSNQQELDTDNRDVKPTPILAQLLQVQGQERLQAAHQQFTAHSQQIQEQLKIHQHRLMQLRGQLNSITQTLANLSNSKEESAQPQAQALKQQARTLSTAAHEEQQQCQSLVSSQIAVERVFAQRQTAIALETGMAAQYRAQIRADLEMNKMMTQSVVDELQKVSASLQNMNLRRTAMVEQIKIASPEAQSAGTAALKQHDAQMEWFLNRRRQLAEQQGALTSRVQILHAQIAAIESALEDKGDEKYCNLMLESEKKWLISIQSKQMHSDNPYVDEYYAQALNRKRSAMMQAMGIQKQGSNRSGPMPKKLGYKSQKGSYEPLAFTNTLGQLKATSTRAPHELIKAPSRGEILGDEDDDVGGHQSVEIIERSRNRRSLVLIEKAFTQLLISEDQEYKLENHKNLSQRARTSITAQRNEAIENAFALLKVQTNTQEKVVSDKEIRRILKFPKGKSLVQRLLPLLSIKNKHAFLLSLIRMISSLLQVDVQSDKGREHISGLMTMVLPAIIVATGSVPLPVLSSCLEEAIQYYPVEDTARSEKLISEFGASLLYAVCRGADTQLGSGSVPAEQQNEWTANVARFASTQATTFARVLQAEKGNNNKVGLLWEFISLLAAHSAEEARDSLAKSLKDLAESMPPEVAPSASTFLKFVSETKLTPN